MTQTKAHSAQRPVRPLYITLLFALICSRWFVSLFHRFSASMICKRHNRKIDRPLRNTWSNFVRRQWLELAVCKSPVHEIDRARVGSDASDTLSIQPPLRSIIACKDKMANDATSKTVAFEPQRREDGSAAEVQEALLRGSESSECLEPRNTLLFPGLYPVVCCSLKQTSFPRLWCLKMVSNPYPFLF